MNAALVRVLFIASYVWRAHSTDDCNISEHWNYNSRDEKWGPDAWKLHNSSCAGGHQSPININQSLVESPSIPLVLKFINYDRTLDGVLKNIGKTVKLKLKGSKASINLGNSLGDYDLFEVHFHWAQDNSFGSEHAIHGRYHPIEAHFVHSKRGVPESARLGTPNGLAVVGVFYKIGTNDKAFRNLFSQLKEVKYCGQEVTVTDLKLDDLLPTPQSFFRYSGSLTTPPCSEVVVWSVLATPAFITADQLRMLRLLHWEEKQPLQGNFRRTMPLNGRKIYLQQN